MAEGSSAGAGGSGGVSREEVFARWEVARSQIAQRLTQHLVIAFLGSASAGKDAAIRALFGVDFGEVDPIPGSTERVRVAALDAQEQVMIVNAPGFGDVRTDVDAAARQVLQHLDVAIYVVNSDGGATIDERRDLDAVRALGRPVLVCLNKIDLIRENQRAAFVEATLAQLGVAREQAAVTAFDPLPALADAPIGLERVVSWIHKTLDEQGKALLFAKHLRSRALACDPIIAAAARKAAVAGSLPVPGADMAAITAIQVQMISEIAEVFEARIERDVVLFILGEALAGSSKGFVRWAVSALKTAGWVPGGQIAEVAVAALGATIAGAATYGVGRAAVAFMQRGQDLTGNQLRDIFDDEATRYRHRLRGGSSGSSEGSDDA